MDWKPRNVLGYLIYDKAVLFLTQLTPKNRHIYLYDMF